MRALLLSAFVALTSISANAEEIDPQEICEPLLNIATLSYFELQAFPRVEMATAWEGNNSLLDHIVLLASMFVEQSGDDFSPTDVVFVLSYICSAARGDVDDMKALIVEALDTEF